MNLLLQILKAAVLLLTVITLGALGRLFWYTGSLSRDITGAQETGTSILSSLKSTADDLKDTSSAVKQLVRGTHANGDDGLAFLTRNVLQQAAQTSNVIRQTSIQERNGLKALTEESGVLLRTSNSTIGKIGQTADSVNNLTVSLDHDTLPALNKSIGALNQTIADVDDHGMKTLDTTTESLHSLNLILADPSWHNTLLHIDHTTGNIESTTGQINTTVHDILNPRKRSFWETIGLGIVKSMIPRPYLVIN